MSEVGGNEAQAGGAKPANCGKCENAASRGSAVMLTVYICAAIGGTIAAIADLVQKEQASAVLKMTSISARHLNLAMPPLYVFVIVVFLGVLLCFVFQPKNRKAGFAVGAGVIASIMTVTPYQPLQTGQPPRSPAATQENTMLRPHGSGLRLATSDFSRFRLAATPVNIAAVPVRNDLAVPVEVLISFYDRNSRQAYQQLQAIAAGTVRIFEFSAGSRQGNIDGEFFLEVAGERSSYINASGTAPYRTPEVRLTQVFPAFAQARIDAQALNRYLQEDGSATQPAADADVRAIYNKPTGFINQLQQRLLTPRKW